MIIDTITTRADLDSLPEGTIVAYQSGVMRYAATKTTAGWLTTGCSDPLTRTGLDDLVGGNVMCNQQVVTLTREVIDDLSQQLATQKRINTSLVDAINERQAA